MHDVSLPARAVALSLTGTPKTQIAERLGVSLHTVRNWLRAQAKPVGNEWERTLAFQCRVDQLPPFVQNYRFHPERKFEIDMAFVPQKIGVEINGGVFNQKAHGSIKGILRDMSKRNLLVACGWRVLCYTPAEVHQGVAIAGLKALLLLPTGENR